jgi:hypothetical protein
VSADQARNANPAGQARRGAWVVLGVLIVGLLIGFGWRMWSRGGPTAHTALAPAPATVETRRIRATLFYVAESGDALVAVDREVPFAAAPAEQALRIIEAQLATPAAGLVSAIPPGTVIRHLYITSRAEAYIDLSPEVVSAHLGGSLGEALTVYAIVNALLVNLPDLTSAQILIDGKEVDTLAGHVDLRRPLRKSMQWVQKDNGHS